MWIDAQITGGSSGIGKHLARAAIRRGASIVTLVARNKVKSASGLTQYTAFCCNKSRLPGNSLF